MYYVETKIKFRVEHEKNARDLWWIREVIEQYNARELWWIREAIEQYLEGQEEVVSIDKPNVINEG